MCRAWPSTSSTTQFVTVGDAKLSIEIPRSPVDCTRKPEISAAAVSPVWNTTPVPEPRIVVVRGPAVDCRRTSFPPKSTVST